MAVEQTVPALEEPHVDKTQLFGQVIATRPADL